MLVQKCKIVKNPFLSEVNPLGGFPLIFYYKIFLLTFYCFISKNKYNLNPELR